MQIQVGEIKMEEITDQNIVIQIKGIEEKQIITPSKTSKYLVPCLKEYGPMFTNRLRGVYKVAAGIGDAILVNRDIKYEKHVFILLDSKIAPDYFISFLKWIKEQTMFVDDYVYGDIQKSTFHMVVLKFPEKYYTSFDKFKLGKYSEMFGEEDIEKFFENHPTSKAVLIKEHSYRIKFTRKLNKEFNLSGKHVVTPEYWKKENLELDMQPTLTTEIFNHHLTRK